MGNGSRMDVECLESLLDRPAIRAPFIFAYIAVFLICLIGNSFTIVVICAHRSMRTATNFFLANLAVADLLVAIFCVLQNMFQLVGMSNGHWPLGETFCRLYAFVIHLVPCTGIGILVCISVEKYIAVLHPLLALKLLTPRFRSLMMASIWVISLLCNLPYYTTTVYRRWGTIASCSRAHQIISLISTRNMVTLSFVIWYCIPLCTIAFLYTRIGLVLWHSAPLKKLTHQQAAQSSEMSTVMSQTGGQQQEQRKRSLFGYRMSASAALTNGTTGTALAGSGGMANGTGNGTVDAMANGGGGNRCSKRSHSQPSGGTGPLQTLPLIRVNRSGTMSSESGSGSHVEDEDADDEEEMISREKKRGATYAAGENGTAQQQHSPMSTTANGQQKNSLPSAGGGSAVVVTTMESRKKIIRLLIAIVCSFSILTLPHHARLLHGVWSQQKLCVGGFEALYQPISYLLLFLSSSCNPFLYAFMSQRFRSAIRDIFKCRRGRIRRKSTRTRTQNSDIVGCAISTGGEGLSRCSSLTRLNNSGTQQNGHNHLANGGATRLTTVASERNLTMPNGGEQQQQKTASNGGTNNNHLKPFMSSPMSGQKNGRSGSGGSGSTASSLVYATQRSNGSIQMAVVYRKCA